MEISIIESIRLKSIEIIIYYIVKKTSEKE
jgi:hypothetical protein